VTKPEKMKCWKFLPQEKREGEPEKTRTASGARQLRSATSIAKRWSLVRGSDLPMERRSESHAVSAFDSKQSKEGLKESKSGSLIPQNEQKKKKNMSVV